MEFGVAALPKMRQEVFERIFAAFSQDPDFEYALIDGTIVKVHRHGTGAKGGLRIGHRSAIGKSRGGLTTKIEALVAALGNLARFILLPGQRHDSLGVEPLLDGVALGVLVGDKAFDSDWLRVELNEHGTLAVIPPKCQSLLEHPL
jgi:hypothetical protein